MDLAAFVNAPRSVTLDGREYLVSALTLSEWGPIQGWIKRNVPGPVKLLSSEDLSGLTPEDRRAMMAVALEAQRNWPPRIGSLAWFNALDGVGGHAEFLFCALSKHQPEFTRADAARLNDRLSTIDVLPVVRACLGSESEEEHASPKA